MKPLYIFDLDGTLSLSAHRAHFLADTTDPLRWDKWHAACGQDPHNKPVMETALGLLCAGADVWIWTGRCESTLSTTLWWLRASPLGDFRATVGLKMRPVDDHREDTALKREWLIQMGDADRDRLVAVFEDRDRMVRAWREWGVACFQVAPGDF